MVRSADKIPLLRRGVPIVLYFPSILQKKKKTGLGIHIMKKVSEMMKILTLKLLKQNHYIFGQNLLCLYLWLIFGVHH